MSEETTTPLSRDSEGSGIPARFFADPDFDFEARMALGLASQGVGDIGGVLVTLASIEERARWFFLAAVEAYSRARLRHGPDGPRLFQALRCDKEHVRFTRREGAGFHCQPLGRALTDVRMFDFFADRLARVRTH